jgi:broad-specificity NMP kinase
MMAGQSPTIDWIVLIPDHENVLEERLKARAYVFVP